MSSSTALSDSFPDDVAPSESGVRKSAEPPPPDDLPDLGEKYIVERLLGEGGMGLVFLAHHRDLDQPVAIKVVRKELAAREDIVERMLREARTAARLRSEHVARVLDAGRVASGSPYIVLEYLDGCDLEVLLFKDGSVTGERAVDYILQACEGIAEAHSHGIVHRDLKPENLFLTTRADGTPIIKVLDFGISKSLDGPSNTSPSMVVGSPDYMAPEQIRGEASCGVGADIWSLGTVLYELVTGERPFAAENIQRTYAKILHAEPLSPELRALVPPPLAAAIMRCLRKDARDRFVSIADFAAAIAPHGGPGSFELAARVARVVGAARSSPDRAKWLVRQTASNARPLPNAGMEPFATTIGAPTPVSKRRLPRTLAFGGTLALSSIVAIGWSAHGASRAQVRAMESRPFAAVSFDASAPPSIGTTARVAAPHPSASATERARVAVAAPSAVPARMTPAPRAVVSRPSPSAVDAWNPDAFGGRD